MEKEFRYIQMEKFIKVNGFKIKNKVKDFFCLKMGTYIKVSFKMENLMDKEFIYGNLAKNMREIGYKETNKV